MTDPWTPFIRFVSFSWTCRLLVILVTGIVVTTLLGSLGLLPPYTSGAATTEGRGQGKVNVLLGVKTNNEGRNVDDLLSDTVKILSTTSTIS